MFPYVRDAPSAIPLQASSLRSPPPQATSLRSQKPAWHRAPKSAVVPDNRQRVLVFIAGGITYSEKREVYQLSSSLNKDIFIGKKMSVCASRRYGLNGHDTGSTHVCTPRQMVDDLKVLDLGGAGSKAIPNGLRDRREGHRPYQDFYDDKYFTKEAAPRPSQGSLPPPAAHKIVSPSPTSSFQGSISSLTPSAKEDKKKRKGLFRF